MITAQIKIHDEPVFTHYQPYKTRPSTYAERQKDIDEELLRYVEVDVRIGDQFKTKSGLNLEVTDFATEDDGTNLVTWFQGNPCCLLCRNLNVSNGGQVKYSFAEVDWSSHKKIADRNDNLNTVNAASMKC